jgi:hypothetical protein
MWKVVAAVVGLPVLALFIFGRSVRLAQERGNAWQYHRSLLGFVEMRRPNRQDPKGPWERRSPTSEEMALLNFKLYQTMSG